MALDPNVVDVFLSLANQTPGKHQGPIGRITSLFNAQVKHFLPSAQNQPQRIVVEPREAFQSLTTTLRDSSTGATASGSWSDPELLASLGEQLLSICGSVPRVYNNADWTYYGSSRVPTNQLSEDVLHTTNHVLAASDEATLNGVTCFTYTEQSQQGPIQIQTAMVAFRSSDRAWVRTPSQLFSNASGPALARVVQDGTYFWVFFSVGAKIVVNVYDTHGVLIAFDQSTIDQVWTPLPGYWDIAAFNNAGSHYVLLMQPDGFTSTNANVDARYAKCTVSGSVITIVQASIGLGGSAGNCSGPIAFANSSATGLPTIVSAASAGFLWMIEFTHTLLNNHAYTFGAVLAGSQIPDSLTGWMENNVSGSIAHVAYSLLSNFSPPAGPTNDPGLRYTRSYSCTRAGGAGSVVLTNQVNNVLLQSRAFQIDNDWYAATYYQGGNGNLSSASPITVATNNPADYFTGDIDQPVTVHPLDFTTGATVNLANGALGNGYVPPTQGIASIAFTAGDLCSPTPSGVNWTIGAGTFVGSVVTSAFADTTTGASAVGAILHVTGAINPQNNGDWWVLSVAGSGAITTESISLQGNTAVFEHLPITTTYALTQVWPLLLPLNPNWNTPNIPYPDAVAASRFIGGTVTVAGATGPNTPLNGTYSIYRMYFGGTSHWRGFTTPYFTLDPEPNIFLLTKTSGAAGVPGTGTYQAGPGTSGSITITPLLSNAWGLTGLQTDRDTRSGINVNLVVSDAQQAGNNGTFAETASPMPSAPYGLFMDITGSQTGQRAEVFVGNTVPLPTISRQLADPSKAFTWHLTNATFDASYLNALMTVIGASHAEDNGLYQITTVLDSHTVVATPADGRSGQTLYNMTGSETITISKSANAGSPEYQPCWYLTPLSTSQKVAGRWDYGIAYADWRFDGNAKANASTFERNGYPLALSSVVRGTDGLQLVLPYRAQSFTAGQTINSANGNIVGVQTTAESTVGLKQFSISDAHGQAVAADGELLLPGLQASEFTSSGFTEDGINLGPEKPFIVSQTTDGAIALALSLLATYQYVVCFEVTDESGDRVWSVVSPPLDVTLTGTQNTVTIGGRMPGPTLRTVGVSIYRTAMVGFPQVATTQHYKITNDLNVNGPGFTFASVNGGPDSDTWQFKDQTPDASILSSEVLYTDSGELQHFPAPAFRQGVASWKGCSWVVGYDRAVWKSAEKTEGDAEWFHPAFRFTFPVDDEPVAVAALDSYMIVFFANSAPWYIPAAQFPDNTGKNGTLPTPLALPFPNGCTGFAATVNAGTPGAGVAYSSTAGGIWLIDRSLRNTYLSQPMQDELQLGVTGLAVDGQQRLLVATGSTDLFVYDQLPQAWYHWRLPTAAQLITNRSGRAVYQDSSLVSVYTPDNYTDRVPTASGIAPDVTLALSEFGNVRGLKSVWACNIVGEYRGPHNLNAVISYPDEPDEPDTTFGPFPADPGEPYIFEINPMIEESTSYGLRVFVDFAGVGTPGNSMALELLSFEVGIEPNLSKVRDSQRIPGR